MADLFDAMEERRRGRLRALGYHEAVGLALGVTYWRAPDGALITEDEAFRRLDRQDAADGGAHG